MKNIKYIIFVIVFLFLNIFYVKASCTNEEITDLEYLVSKIKITYRHLGKIENDDEVYDNLFELKVKNVPNDVYISLYNNSIILNPIDGEIITTFNNGMWDFDVYSNKCGIKIDTIEVYIPRFNEYSLDPLCEGINGDDFPLCGKYYEYDVSYESFKDRVNHYRSLYNVENDDNNNEINVVLNDETIINFVIRYRLNIVISLAAILIILIIIIILKRKKKRGVLE